MTVRRSFSLIIPTLNSAQRLRELLLKVKAQTLQPEEVIIIDSSSSDGTADAARSMGARVIVIARAEFDHGGTRTLAGKAGSGEILLYMTDDAVPASADSFSRLLEAFDDTAVAVAFGRQLPTKSASLLSYHLRSFNYPAQSYRRSYADRVKYGMRTFFLSNSFSAYRRAALERISWFKENIICAEDACAAYELLKRGGTLAYQADACVYHSHDYSPWQEFARYFDTGVMHSCEKEMFADLGRAEGEGARYLLSALRFLGPRIWMYPDFFARVLMKYLGYCLGKTHRALPLSLKIRFSMNKNWWRKTLHTGDLSRHPAGKG